MRDLINFLLEHPILIVLIVFGILGQIGTSRTKKRPNEGPVRRPPPRPELDEDEQDAPAGESELARRIREALERARGESSDAPAPTQRRTPLPEPDEDKHGGSFGTFGDSLEGASLEGASLEGRSLEGESLEGASLEGAPLDPPPLSNAIDVPGVRDRGAPLVAGGQRSLSTLGADTMRSEIASKDFASDLVSADLGSLDRPRVAAAPSKPATPTLPPISGSSPRQMWMSLVLLSPPRGLMDFDDDTTRAGR